jgi:hypothetical protein
MASSKQYKQLELIIDYIVVVDRLKNPEKVWKRLRFYVGRMKSLRLRRVAKNIEKEQFDQMLEKAIKDKENTESITIFVPEVPLW